MMNLSGSGSGSYRPGGPGSLSSSSLSPLAPPFKVDKTVLKLNSASQSVNYSDVPTYTPYFDSTGQFWNPSSSAAAGQSLVGTESMAVNTSCSSCPGIYGYPDSQSNTTATGAYAVNSGAVDAYDPFSYDPFPNRLSSTAEEGEKPYYTAYVPSAPHKDGYLSLGVSSGHELEWLPGPSSVLLSDCGTSPVDQPQARDGDCIVNWGSFWSGMNKNEQDKWSGFGQGLSSKSSNLPDSSNNKTPFPFDGTDKSQFSDDVNTHPFTDGTCSLPFPSEGGNRSALKQDGCFDIFGGTYLPGNFSKNQQDSMSVLGCSRKPTSVSVLMSKDSSHIQEPMLELAMDVRGPPKAKASSPGGHFSQSGFYVFGCSSTTSTNPATMTRPCADSSSFALNTLAPMKLNPRSSAASDNSIGPAGYGSFCPVEPQMSVKLKQQPSVVIRRPMSSVMPSKIDEMADSQFKSKNASDKIPLSPPKIQHFTTDGLILEVNEAQAAFSGGTDAHTPAEDSPCWIGASKRFSPFEVSEVNSPEAPDCHYLRAQEPEIKSLLLGTSDSRDSFFAKDVPLKDNEEKFSATKNPLQFDLNAVGGPQFGYDTCLSTNKSCTLNQSKSLLDPGITLDTPPFKGPVPNLGSRTRSESTASVGSENSRPAVIKNLSSLSSGIENKCTNSAAEDTTVKHCKSNKITDGNIDVSVLLKTMTKLSEIFRCYTFEKRAGVPEQHTIAVKHIIANLNASLLILVGETTPSKVSLRGTLGKEIPISPMVKDDAISLAAAVKIAGIAEGLLDSVPVKDDTVTDADMSAVSKKILHVDLQEEEEMDQQKLLYKTLWLEAEASLCAMTAKARLLRAKAEMDKAPASVKDVQGAIGLASVDKVIPFPSEHQKPSEVSQTIHSETPDTDKDHIPIPNTEDTKCIKLDGPETSKDDACSPSPHATSPGITVNVSDGSGIGSHAVDVEASVMSRYQILKNRLENAEGPNCECEQPSGGYDAMSNVCPRGYDSPNTETICVLNRADFDSLNEEHCRLPGGDNYLPAIDSSSPEYQILEGGDSSAMDEQFQHSELLSNSVGVLEEGEASLMARFRIIQSRINQLNFGNMDQTFGQTNEEVMEDDGVGLLKQKNDVLRSKFGPYPNFAEDTDANQFDSCINTAPFLTQHCKPTMLKTEIFESWYGNDGSSSDWERVSKDDLQRLN